MRKFDEAVATARWTIDIPTMLELHETAPDTFRNVHAQPNVYRGVFGGQLVAQALAASDRTVPDRTVHSLHSYFLRAGEDGKPIDFHVGRVRDGGRFSTRHVVVRQGETDLLIMNCSYRTPLNGYSHYRSTEIAFEPDRALQSEELRDAVASDGKRYPALFDGAHPVELRIPRVEGFLAPASDAKRHYWLRAPGAERVDDLAAQRQILAFLSDFMFCGVTLSPHTVALPSPELFVASLDHSIWFHRPVRCDDWLLFETEGTNAENGVNLARGLVYDRAGYLVATLAQESLQMPVSGA